MADSAASPPRGSVSSANQAYANSYDAAGRIFSAPLGFYTYGDTAHKHAATAVGSNYSYTYDANGAVQTRTEDGITYKHTYDLEGRQATVLSCTPAPCTPTIVSARFVYDGDGDLAAKLAGDSNILVAAYSSGGASERDPSTATTRSYYSFGGHLVAQRETVNGGTSTLHSLHHDHLGSTTMQTAANGAWEGEQQRGVYGEPWLPRHRLPVHRPA
jgi:hypothetical protein